MNGLMVFLSALYVIFIALSCLLGAVILILAAVLFIPVRYIIIYEPEGGGRAMIKLAWFLKAFRMIYIKTPEHTREDVFFLWMPLKSPKKKGKKAEPSVLKNETGSGHGSDNEEPAVSPHDENDKKTNWGFISNIKKKGSLLAKIINHPDRNAVLGHSVLLIKRLLKALKPKQIRIAGDLGFPDPAITGYARGFACALAPFLPPKALDIQWDFNKPAVNAAVRIKGAFTVWSLVWPAGRYILSKPIWRIIKQYKKRKEDGDEQ